MLFKRRDWMGWDEYKDRIDMIDLYLFQQHTRQESVRNLV